MYPDEQSDDLAYELLMTIKLSQKLYHLKQVLDTCEFPEESIDWKPTCQEWLRRCKKEMCRLFHDDDVFSRPFMVKRLEHELAKFQRWLLPYMPTQKMVVQSVPLLLRHFSYEGATDKIPVIQFPVTS